LVCESALAKKRNIVIQPDELFGEEGHNSFCTAIQLWKDAPLNIAIHWSPFRARVFHTVRLPVPGYLRFSPTTELSEANLIEFESCVSFSIKTRPAKGWGSGGTDGQAARPA
jgi:hypothetical protein